MIKRAGEFVCWGIDREAAMKCHAYLA